MPQLYLGTSGYNYQHWIGKFYPPTLPKKDWLKFYAQHFNSLEVNATFYHLFPKRVFANWAQQTPTDFFFTIKGSRYITHLKKLKEVKKELENFLINASGLGEKLSCILWQFPRSFKFKESKDLALLEEFLKNLPKDYHQAFEFRDPSWFQPPVFQLLNQKNCGIVINDSPHFPTTDQITNKFVYIRFHGPGNLYSSSYSYDQLATWAKKIKEYLRKYDVYCYFNNDINGYAVENGLTLKKLLK